MDDRLHQPSPDATAEPCGHCADLWVAAELIWAPDGSGLCPLCAYELVLCECGEAVERHTQQPAATVDWLCVACADLDSGVLAILDARPARRPTPRRRAA